MQFNLSNCDRPISCLHSAYRIDLLNPKMRVKKSKSGRMKRLMKAKEPQIVEGDKVLLAIRGQNTSAMGMGAMHDLVRRWLCLANTCGCVLSESVAKSSTACKLNGLEGIVLIFLAGPSARFRFAVQAQTARSNSIITQERNRPLRGRRIHRVLERAQQHISFHFHIAQQEAPEQHRAGECSFRGSGAGRPDLPVRVDSTSGSILTMLRFSPYHSLPTGSLL